MKQEKFYSNSMDIIKEDYPDIYDTIVKLNETVYSGSSLDYKTQKLIAIGIAASKCDKQATRKQIKSGIKELGITKEEVMDVLKIVLLTSGMPAFMHAVTILNALD
ncbi:MAG: carboxymuconolactone decarboxylase family protein [Methanobrevibacter boviskoreani]|uniref:carboxymuconolactone decarboxylase family protein n=1 Tax=Methanobrevibacter TaxID=2172 RepID=UPI0003348349|nr:carboxymuconolactone decarboxylase family protein [Methanobrevibacter sp. AbM4]